MNDTETAESVDRYPAQTRRLPHTLRALYRVSEAELTAQALAGFLALLTGGAVLTPLLPLRGLAGALAGATLVWWWLRHWLRLLTQDACEAVAREARNG